jgi:hypothetical protein
VTRQRLPNRRGHELLTFKHDRISYRVPVGRFADGGLAEIFQNRAQHGTGLDVKARDAAVAPSLLLALTRNSDAWASGPLAHALDLLADGT